MRHILEMQYKSISDGLSGNDDTGQMSVWYILSSLGFYPIAIRSEDYAIGSPAVNNTVIILENGKNFEIEAINQNPKNVYVQKFLLNGKKIKNFTLKHSDIMNGEKIVFYMNNKPKK